MLRAAFIGAGLAVAASAAGAATVTLDPGGDEVVRTDEAGLTGFFAGTDFVFTAETDEPVGPPPDGIGRAHIDFINTNATGSLEAVQELTIRRSGGRTFDLASLTIPRAHWGLLGLYQGTERASGDTIYDRSVLVVDSVHLEGVTASGGIATSSFVPINSIKAINSLDASSFRTSSVNDDPVFGVEAFGSDFTDLVSLSFTASAAGADPCDPLNLAQVDPRFALSGPCAETPEGGPLTSVSVTYDINIWNDLARYDLRGITLETDVAPIPVPASLPLLLAGVGALAAGGRLSSRRRRAD